MNKKILCLSALALSMSLSQVTLACSSDQCSSEQCSSEHMKGFSGDRFEKVTEKLDLNAEQTVKVHAIKEQAKKELEQKFEEIHAVRHQINELYRATKLDESKLDSLVQKETEIFGSVLKMGAMERRDVYNVLTEQQRVKLADLIQQREEKHQENKKH